MALSAFLVLAALIWGCGGGGSGGGGGNGGGNGGGGANIYPEASLNGGSVLDPLNFQINQKGQFFLASYDSTTGVRTPIMVSGWTTTDTGNAAGVLNSNGSFTANAISNPTVYTATVTYGGINYSVPYKVNPVQALISGQVVNMNNNTGVRNVRLLFYNNSGTQVGSARSSFSGSVLASVPTTTTRFGIDPTTIDTSIYYSTFSYNALWFSPLITTCTGALPSGLAKGSVTQLTTTVQLDPNGNVPPPPPTGCQ